MDIHFGFSYIGLIFLVMLMIPNIIRVEICIEIFKEENKLTGKEVYELFEKYEVLKYLQDGYDMLHTQGDRWIMNDINEFLKIRGHNVKQKYLYFKVLNQKLVKTDFQLFF